MAGSAPYDDVPSYRPGGGPGYQAPPGPRSVAAGRLWATGAATAVVAALVAVVATMFVRGVLDVPLFAPRGAGVWGDVTTGYLAAWAAAGAVVGTGLLHLLLLTVARPRAFFVWIAGLATVALALLPFTTDLASDARLATAAVFLAVGATITGLLSATAYSVAPDRGGGTW
ncbi:hypothetical protein SHJG_0639 [Streptomyces hygroscopicus subsp. jinggangensis 5008]|nr:hypothetical protein SHJG_0639 [Streptomyces hygroscopicus subsp. jinggangensis 5008]AGF60138.1 hypothetical protein SHJGH_0472 [Streptomyces hygroscopicus subsp. jinggangensis TL01]